MNKLFFVFILVSRTFFSQSFAPEPNEAGTTAIHKDSSIIVSWGTNVQVTRGYKNISNPSAGLVGFGVDLNGTGQAEGDGMSVVSLGDSGQAIITFSRPIQDLAGPDFAIFENGFQDNYMELAHVEVSSDGLNFFRFVSTSETPLNPQLSNASLSDCRYINNLAGKYRQGYGVPFDLFELNGTIGLDLQAVTHIKLIDVVGSVDPIYGTTDFYGTLINDPYPTEFESGGFDLDAVGVIHEAPAGIEEDEIAVQIYPVPACEILTIELSEENKVFIFDIAGKKLFETEREYLHLIDVRSFPKQTLVLRIETDNSVIIKRITLN